MTKEQFLSAVNDIDDKFIKEIADDPPKVDLTDERPQMIYLKRERIPFWNIAAAALVCVIAAGIFAAVKLSAPIRTTDSTVNSSGAESDPVSISDPENSGKISESAAFAAVLDLNDPNDPNAPSGGSKTFISDPVRKSNSRGFAEVSIKCRGVGEENPLYISVCRKEGEYHAVSGEIKFTGGDSDKILINYTEKVGAGDNLVLVIRAENSNAFAAGLWNP